MDKQTKLEKYADIQAMVQKEIRDQFPALYAAQAKQYGVAKVPLHRHNGIDAPKINAWDLNTSQGASGSITMSTDNTRYKIGLNVKPGVSFAPSQVRFNGIAVYPSTASPTIRALVEGDAFIGPSFYLQPLTASEVTVGGTPMTVVQSSSYILVNDSGAGPATQALVSEGHIVSVRFNGVTVARATIPDRGVYGVVDEAGPLQGGAILVDVELETDWHIIGNFLIT